MTNYRIIPGVILIILGISALLHINLWEYVWPAILIFIGIKILTGSSRRPNGDWMRQEEAKADTIDLDVVFGAMNKKIISDNFGGGKVNFVFGGGELDLREAKIEDDKTIELEVNNVFGGGKIMVPKDWLVTSQVTGVLGGFVNSTKVPNKSEEKGKLVIKGGSVFGGGEITN